MRLKVFNSNAQVTVAELCQDVGFRVPESALVSSGAFFEVSSSSKNLDVHKLVRGLDELSTVIDCRTVLHFSREHSSVIVPPAVLGLVSSESFLGRVDFKGGGRSVFNGSCPVLSLQGRVPIREWTYRSGPVDALLAYSAGLVPSAIVESLEMQAAGKFGGNNTVTFDVDVSKGMFAKFHAAGFSLGASGVTNPGGSWRCMQRTSNLQVAYAGLRLFG